MTKRIPSPAPRRGLLTPAQRAAITALPSDPREVTEHYALTPADRELIDRRRTAAARPPTGPASPSSSACCGTPAGRGCPARICRGRCSGSSPTSSARHRPPRVWLAGVARTSDDAVFLVGALLGELRGRRVLAPPIGRLERIAASARHRARREAYAGTDGGLGLTGSGWCLTDCSNGATGPMAAAGRGAR